MILNVVSVVSVKSITILGVLLLMSFRMFWNASMRRSQQTRSLSELRNGVLDVVSSCNRW